MHCFIEFHLSFNWNFRSFWCFWIFICIFCCWFLSHFVPDTLWKIQIGMAAREMRWTILFISEPIDHSCIAVIKIAAIRYDHIKYLPNTQIHSECILTTTTAALIRYSYTHTRISKAHSSILTKNEGTRQQHTDTLICSITVERYSQPRSDTRLEHLVAFTSLTWQCVRECMLVEIRIHTL